MAFIFRLPDIGEGLEEAEIVEWFVAIGDEVLRDQPLVEVLTDKASSELPSPVAGTVLLLGANEGTRLQVGEVLIEIDDGSTTPRVADEPTSTQTDTAKSQPTEPPPETAQIRISHFWLFSCAIFVLPEASGAVSYTHLTLPTKA